ncbi:T9SS type A sorting domain-containing protein [Mangrovibacterium sp.]|uniref:T9SS type A sorting domain-containing protein n=1 Tax=Mangrovibacterium sp. TaxID=1961364 RepID=UPI00356910AF
MGRKFTRYSQKPWIVFAALFLGLTANLNLFAASVGESSSNAAWHTDPFRTLDGNEQSLSVEDEIEDRESFVVYPNPFNDVLYIRNYDKINRLFIINVVGQRVKEVVHPANMISTTELRKGIYFITLMLDDDVIVSTQRIIKR